MSHFCHHIGLFADDPQRLISFYTEKIGFLRGETKALSQDLMEKIFGVPSPATLTKLKLDQVILEIISVENKRLKESPCGISGYNHWGFGVEDKDALSQRLKEKGIPLLEYQREGRTILFIKDPEENLIEIYQA